MKTKASVSGISQERAIKNAFASARMEGFDITFEIESNTRRVLNNEINMHDCIIEMLSLNLGEERCLADVI